MPNITPAAAALTVTGIWQASIMGLSIGTIAIVTGFTILGGFGRLGFEIARQGEQSGGINWGKIGALFGGTMISSTTIAVLWLGALKSAGVQNDGVTVFGAVFFGIIGPKALLWLINFTVGKVNKVTGLNLPMLGADGAAKP